MYLESLYGDGGETCVPSNPIPNGSVWGTTRGLPEPQGKYDSKGLLGCDHCLGISHLESWSVQQKGLNPLFLLLDFCLLLSSFLP